MGIQIENISKFYGHFTALRDVSLDVQAGELVALLGPSGSGKTTLLRIIAGLESPDEGRVILSGEDAAYKNPRDRNVGFVFQHYALFRHMTVFENVAFGLKVRPRRDRLPKKEIFDRVFSLLKLVQLDFFAARYPAQLSGGQRQRVALARALAVEPKVLLLDEPFGALDAQVRKELRRWLKKLHEKIHVTSVFVTHDQEEALEVADRLVIMNNGAVEQIGTPEEIYHRPANPFVFRFLGDVNLFHCRTENGHYSFIGQGGDISDKDGSVRQVFIRPHLFDISLTPGNRESIQGSIQHINAAGPSVKVEIVSEWGGSVQVNIPQDRYQRLGLQKGMSVYLIPLQMSTFDETLPTEEQP
ncbi:sulfate ABC transporter ATP-binding protein [candidate division KSB1 bacterium]|nr:sulfate ABC transporter ATP-binding protein [candidate division KSB1 bacterium]